MRTTIVLASLTLLAASAIAADAPPPDEPAGLREIADAGRSRRAARDDRQARRLRHAPHAVRHEIGQARHRRRAALGADALRGVLQGLRRLPRDRDAVADRHRQARAAADRSHGRRRDPARHERSRPRDRDHRPPRLARDRRDGRQARRARRERRRLGHRRRHRSRARAVASTSSPRRSSSPCCPARSRACTAARSSPTTPRQRGWHVEADLNNDIVGNTQGQDGVVDNTIVRVFSEGTKSDETLEQAKYRRYHGGEVDSPSRNVARYVAALAEQLPRRTSTCAWSIAPTATAAAAIRCRSSKRAIPAVRFTEAHENYTRQHQDLRTENGIQYGDTIDGVDFAYLAQVTRLNVLAMAAMAAAPAPPSGVEIDGARLDRHDGQLAARRRRRRLPRLVARHDRAAMGEEPLGRQRDERDAEERRSSTIRSSASARCRRKAMRARSCFRATPGASTIRRSRQPAH